MITRITRFLLLLQLGIAFGLALLALRTGRITNPVAATFFGLGTVLLIRALITANNFFLSSRYRGKTPDELRLNWRQACRLFLSEFKATMLSSSWTMAFFSFEKRVPEHPEGLPVLLIHGYACNSGYWHSMSKALLQANIAHYALDLEPVFSDIETYVPAVHKAAVGICAGTGHQKLIIVAHSMGGLVARAYLKAYGSAHVAKVITLGTPHNGTGLANFGIGRNSRQMRRDCLQEGKISNDWLRQLARSEDKSQRALFVSLYSHHDNIVAPQTSSFLEGAKNIDFRGVGHVALALHPIIQKQVIEEIRLASRTAENVEAAALE